MSTAEDREWDERQDYGYANPLAPWMRESEIIADQFGPIENEGDSVSAHIEWLNANNVSVAGTAHPGRLEHDGNENTVAAIRIVSAFNGDGVIIEGRPETLTALAEKILETAMAIETTTNLTPELQSLYGITTPAPQRISYPTAPPLGQSEHDHNL